MLLTSCQDFTKNTAGNNETKTDINAIWFDLKDGSYININQVKRITVSGEITIKGGSKEWRKDDSQKIKEYTVQRKDSVIFSGPLTIEALSNIKCEENAFYRYALSSDSSQKVYAFDDSLTATIIINFDSVEYRHPLIKNSLSCQNLQKIVSNWKDAIGESDIECLLYGISPFIPVDEDGLVPFSGHSRFLKNILFKPRR